MLEHLNEECVFFSLTKVCYAMPNLRFATTVFEGDSDLVCICILAESDLERQPLPWQNMLDD